MARPLLAEGTGGLVWVALSLSLSLWETARYRAVKSKTTNQIHVQYSVILCYVQNFNPLRNALVGSSKGR